VVNECGIPLDLSRRLGKSLEDVKAPEINIRQKLKRENQENVRERGLKERPQALDLHMYTNIS
jgi:hypothetical protein